MPNSAVQQRIVGGLAASTLGQVIAALSAVILVPLFIRAWDAEGYGRWLTLTALVSYLSLADLGGQSYIGNLLAVAYVEGDKATFRRILSEAISLFALLSGILFLLIALFVTLPNSLLPGLDEAVSRSERIVILSMSGMLLIAIPSGIHVTAYRSTGLFVRASMLGNLTSVLLLGLSAGLLYLQVSPGAYAASLLGFSVARTAFIVWDIQREVPEAQGIRLGLNKAFTGRIYLGGSLFFWLLALASAINQQGLVLVLSAFSTPVAVATFVTHRTAAGLLGYLGNLVRAPLWPEISFLWGQGRQNDIVDALIVLTGTLMLVSGQAGIGLFFFFPAIYPIWTGHELSLNLVLFAILLFQAVLMAGWLTLSLGLMATNQHRTLSIWTIANAVTTIVLAFFLVDMFGATGAALASLIGDLTCSVAVIPVLIGRQLHISPWPIYKTIISSLIVLLCFAILAIALSSFIAIFPAMLLFGLFCILLVYPALAAILGRRSAKQLSNRIFATMLSFFSHEQIHGTAKGDV